MKFRNSQVVIFLLLMSSAFAKPVNLALHKKAVFTQQPTYHLTMDLLDEIQLTDDVIRNSHWYENDKEYTVGWASNDIIEIIFDLEKVCDVGLVKVYTTGGGKAQVEYPDYIVGMGSVDGVNYTPVSLADSNGWVFGVEGFVEPKVMRLNFNVKCRYVKLIVRPTGTVFFSDEIQIMRANNECKIMEAFFLNNREAVDYAERLRQLERNILELINVYRNSEITIENYSTSLEQYVDDLKAYNDNLGSVSMLEVYEQKLAVLRAEYLTSKYKTSWFCVETDPMVPLRSADMPNMLAIDCELYLYQWQNEYGLAAFNLVNCDKKSKGFKLSVSPLTSQDKTFDSEQYISVRRAVNVYSKNVGYFGDPMVLQGSVPFKLQPGEMVQFFVELKSKGLSPGLYNFTIGIMCDREIKTIPAVVEIVNKVFPEENDLMTCNWDYITDRYIVPGNSVRMAVNDLKEHYINVTVIPHHKIYSSSLVSGKDKTTNSTIPEFANELKVRSHADFRLIYLALKSRYKYFGQDIYSDKWSLNFKIFIRDLIRTLKKNGYDYDEYAVYPFDECIDDRFVHVAKLIKQVDSNVRVLVTNSGKRNIDEIYRAADVADIWVQTVRTLIGDKELLTQLKSRCKNVWCYAAELRQGSLLEPNEKLHRIFYRTMPVKAVGLGLEGACFWTYADHKGSYYNYYDKRIYGVIYDGKYSPDNCIHETIVPSKRWQLWRQAVEDAVVFKNYPELLEEFMNKPDNQITSEFLLELRKKADQKK